MDLREQIQLATGTIYGLSGSQRTNSVGLQVINIFLNIVCVDLRKQILAGCANRSLYGSD